MRSLTSISRADSQWFQYAVETLHSLCYPHESKGEFDLVEFLKMGESLFGMELGIISEIYGDTYRVHTVGPNEMGIYDDMTFSLGETLCKEVVDTGSCLYINEASRQRRYKDHPITQGLKIEYYIGSPIEVRGKLFGTLNFTSRNQIERPLDKGDQMVIDLMAKSLGLFMEKETSQSQRNFFLRKLGHEMRGPLNGILGFCEILIEEEQKEENKDMLEIILRSSHSLEDRIKDINSFLMLQNSAIENPDSLSLMATSKQILRELSLVHTSVEDWIHLDLPVSEFLVLNGTCTEVIIKYLLKDCLSRRREFKNIRISLERNEGRNTLVIFDDGPPPPPAIFELFSRSRYFFSYLKDEKLKGLSLDLVMAKLICDEIDANLKVLPLDGGVCFLIDGLLLPDSLS